jgi:Transposase DDE domain
LQVPFKSALSKCRSRISFLFFKEQFNNLINAYELNRPTWRGLRIFATDGDQFSLPASEDILKADYRGYPCKDKMETHYPRMYVVHCLDVLSGVSKDFRYSSKNQELQLALEIATTLESNSVTLYDRLFFCKDLVLAHEDSKSYFFARCKAGETVLGEIREFELSSFRKKMFKISGHNVTLIKIKNPSNAEDSIFATNLPKKYLAKSRIKELYTLRWGVETVNRDFTHTLNIEKWHSKTINGVLQEIYVGLWVMNQGKIQITNSIKKNKIISPERRNFVTANFKSVIEFFNEDLLSYVKKQTQKLMSKLRMLIQRSTEERMRLKRSAPRVVKGEGSRFPSSSLTPRRC